MIALETLFSSPTCAENFTLKPRICSEEEKEYSSPATRDWWHFI